MMNGPYLPAMEIINDHLKSVEVAGSIANDSIILSGVDIKMTNVAATDKTGTLLRLRAFQ